mgnify:CR=1 FL=1
MDLFEVISSQVDDRVQWLKDGLAAGDRVTDVSKYDLVGVIPPKNITSIIYGPSFPMPPQNDSGKVSGGIDLIVIYNSGRYRMAGRGSLAGLLAYGNANDIVCDMAKEVLPVVKHTPVLAGVNGTDPFMMVDELLSAM